MVSNNAVTPNDGSVGHDNVATHDDVVCYVAGGHEEAIVADGGFFFEIVSAMDSDHFAKGVTVADAESGGVAFFVFMVLGGSTQHGTCADGVCLADGGVTGDMDMGGYFAAGPYLNEFVNNGIGSHFDGGVELCARVYDCCRMNHL